MAVAEYQRHYSWKLFLAPLLLLPKKEPIGGVWCCYCRRCSLLLQQEQRRPIIGTAAHSLLMFMVGMILRIECVTDEGDVFVMNEQNVSCAGIVFVLKHFPAVAYCTKLVQI